MVPSRTLQDFGGGLSPPYYACFTLLPEHPWQQHAGERYPPPLPNTVPQALASYGRQMPSR